MTADATDRPTCVIGGPVSKSELEYRGWWNTRVMTTWWATLYRVTPAGLEKADMITVTEETAHTLYQISSPAVAGAV